MQKKMCKFLAILIFLTTFPAFCFPPSQISGEEDDWHFINDDDWSEATVRKEANYWYDMCAQHNLESDTMTFAAKLKLLAENVSLTLDNERFMKEITILYPKQLNLSIEELKDQNFELKIKVEQLKQGKNEENNDPETTKKISDLSYEAETLKRQCIAAGFMQESDATSNAALRERVRELDIEKIEIQYEKILQKYEELKNSRSKSETESKPKD